MIAILLLLSPMYQLNHSSILPQSSPGLSGRHGRKIGKVSAGRRRVEMDGTGEGRCTKCNYDKERQKRERGER